MSSLNSVTLIGRLGRDPEEEVHAGQSSFARLSVATDDGYLDRQGKKVERTTWHSVTVSGKTADFVLKYLHKGSQVLVQGRYLSRKYQTKDGRDAVSWYVQAQRVQSLERGDFQNGNNHHGGRDEY
jgi:single-strand DNA-binding protein